MSGFIETCFDIIALPVQHDVVHLAIALPNEKYRTTTTLPRAALPESGRVPNGRGLSPSECYQSCLGEAAELVCCCEWGDEDLITARLSEMPPQTLTPQALNALTARQVEERHKWNETYRTFDWRPPSLGEDPEIGWLVVEDAFGGTASHAPADFLLIGRRDPGDESAVAVADSNGCAAGSSSMDAKLSAILELIERDATARWWYGRLGRPPIDIALVRELSSLASWLIQRERKTWIFDISTDLMVPVVAAVSSEPDGSDVALGFSAKLTWPMAATSAITEMVQIEFSLALTRMSADIPGHGAQWRSLASMKLPPLDAASKAEKDMKVLSTPSYGDVTYSRILESCARAGVDLWLTNLTRASVGIPTYRAVSTALCHIKPRFKRRRLAAVDVMDLDTQMPLLI